MSRLLIALLMTIGLACLWPGRGAADEGRIFTLWPLADFRASPATDYETLHLLGPLFKWERKGAEHEVALRPLVSSASSPAAATSDLLFPLIRTASGSGFSTWDSLGLLSQEGRTEDVGGGHSFTLFPLVFYDRHEARDSTFAVFPLGGRLVNRFGRDEIRFALFPLYGATRKGTTQTTNILWPVFARIRGENESGIKAWPLFGISEKEGVYRKRFFLWPFFFFYELDLDGENPRRKWVFFPFYSIDTSPRRDTAVVLWPFFSYREDREAGYKEWDFPWPLFGVSRGPERHGSRFLPLFSDEQRGDKHKRWILWPLFKAETTVSDQMERRQHRVLFFLYQDLEERFYSEEGIRKRRVALWPLFHYRQQRGVSRLDLVALVDPFFPESAGVERNWAPLWRIYQAKWDNHGNRAESLLWNLFWQERRPDAFAMELFPLFSWRENPSAETEFSLLKGLIRFRSEGPRRRLSFFFLPWGFAWDGTDPPGET